MESLHWHQFSTTIYHSPHHLCYNLSPTSSHRDRLFLPYRDQKNRSTKGLYRSSLYISIHYFGSGHISCDYLPFGCTNGPWRDKDSRRLFIYRTPPYYRRRVAKRDISVNYDRNLIAAVIKAKGNQTADKLEHKGVGGRMSSFAKCSNLVCRLLQRWSNIFLLRKEKNMRMLCGEWWHRKRDGYRSVLLI